MNIEQIILKSNKELRNSTQWSWYTPYRIVFISNPSDQLTQWNAFRWTSWGRPSPRTTRPRLCWCRVAGAGAGLARPQPRARRQNASFNRSPRSWITTWDLNFTLKYQNIYKCFWCNKIIWINVSLKLSDILHKKTCKEVLIKRLSPALKHARGGITIEEL